MQLPAELSACAQEQAKKDRAREAELAAWRAVCQALSLRREQAREAKVQAELDYQHARTQQEAESAEHSIAAAKAALAAAVAEQDPPEPPPPPPEDEPKLFFQVGPALGLLQSCQVCCRWPLTLTMETESCLRCCPLCKVQCADGLSCGQHFWHCERVRAWHECPAGRQGGVCHLCINLACMLHQA